MARVHWIYPAGAAISCPQAIGRNVAVRLARHHTVIHHQWDSLESITPREGDVLIGHPHPAPWTTFRRSLRKRGWRRVIAVAPYSHGDIVQLAYADAVMPHVDLFLAITGRYWFERVEESAFAHWRPKMRHLDLAVDPVDFPAVKARFGEPWRRKFLFIGHSGWQKNSEYLGRLAGAIPESHFGWIGSGAPIAGVRAHGYQDFSTDEARALVASYDFMITVSRSDANPTTILEAMAWGLIPVCTPQSGYLGEPGIVNIPLDDLDGAVAVLRALQEAPSERLEAMRAANRERLRTHYTWDRFARQVSDAIDSAESPALLPIPAEHRALLRRTASVSPYAPWRARNLLAMLKGAVRRRLIDQGRR